MDWLGLARGYWTTDRAARALTVIDAAERGRPGDVALAALRTDILRSQGDRSRWERSGHDAHPPADRPIRPAPYAVLPGFLDAGFRRRLRRLVAANDDGFGASTVGTGRLDPELRRSLRLRDPDAMAIVQQRFVPLIAAALPGLTDLLAPGLPTARRIECKVTSCPAGSYFHAHRDDRAHEAPAVSNHDRVLSYVCWFHREPARFTGGELFLHDTSTNGYDAVSGTRFVPTSGTLVVFPSGTYHSVLPVGGDEVDLVDTRLAVTGHVRAGR
jgi:predicted 2-oxoglutarate/Fe(II)-dependent dioxygenase YbiX